MFIYSIQAEEGNLRKEAFLIYFLSQSIASAIFIIASFGISITSKTLMLDSSHISIPLICLAIAFKLAIAPIHQWVVKIGKALIWKVLLVMLSWQKIIPLLLLIKSPMGILLATLAFLSLLVGSLTQIKITSLKLIFIFSSIRHLGWMVFPISFSSLIPLFYIIVYTLIFIHLLLKFEVRDLKTLYNQPSALSMKVITLIVFSLAGIPPLLGFILKWISLKVIIISLLYAIVFTLTACVRFYIYIRIRFKALLSQEPESLSQKERKKFGFLWSVNLYLPILLFSF